MGIGIGSAAGAALLIGGLWIAYTLGRRKRRDRAKQAMSELASPTESMQVNELLGTAKEHPGFVYVSQPAELESGPHDLGYSEMDGSGRIR